MLNNAERERVVGMALFKGLTPQQMERVHQLMHRKNVPAGATVIMEDQPGEVAYIVLSGSLKVCVTNEDGSDVIVAVRGPGELVGEMSIIDGKERSATVIAQEETSLLWINREAFWGELWEMPAISYNMALIFSRRIRLLTTQVQTFATLDIRGRIARQLLAYAREHGEKQDESIYIPFRLTQNDLAGMTGASRVRVNQIITYWKRRRYISITSNQHITIHNMKALEQSCH